MCPALSLRFTPVPTSASCVTTAWGRLACWGHRDAPLQAGEAQAARLGPTVPPLARDILHHEHPPSGFSGTSKKSPPRFSGHFVPKAGITA